MREAGGPGRSARGDLSRAGQHDDLAEDAQRRGARAVMNLVQREGHGEGASYSLVGAGPGSGHDRDGVADAHVGRARAREDRLVAGALDELRVNVRDVEPERAARQLQFKLTAVRGAAGTRSERTDT